MDVAHVSDHDHLPPWLWVSSEVVNHGSRDVGLPWDTFPGETNGRVTLRVIPARILSVHLEIAKEKLWNWAGHPADLMPWERLGPELQIHVTGIGLSRVTLMLLQHG